MSAHHKNQGFTLLETILYIGLFGLIFTGIFSSIYPILTGADRLANTLLIESEKAFIITKITYIVNDSIRSLSAEITEPSENSTSTRLIIQNSNQEKYKLEIGDINCQIPQICSNKKLILTKDSILKGTLNNDRIKITDLKIFRSAKQAGELPNYIDIRFTINNSEVVSTRVYLHF